MENELRDAIIGGQLFKFKMDGLGNEWVWEKTKDGFPTSYVNSSDPNAYPPAETDGYTYTPLGQVGNKGRIETGSYVGTGTYGASAPNSLAFGFEPKMVMVAIATSAFAPTSAGWDNGFIYIFGMQKTSIENYQVMFTVSENTLSWYSSSTQAVYQCNLANTVYNYIAIG